MPKKRIVSYGKKIARSKIQAIYKTKEERARAYLELKEKLKFPDLCIAIDFLEKNLIEKRQELIWGNPLPGSYESLGVLNDLPFISEDIIGEINYTLIGVRRYKNEINQFLKLKVDFEKWLIIGEYGRARKVLHEIEKSVCFSLWSLENRFLLDELEGNASQNKELLSEFNEKNRSRGVTKSLAHYLSQRVENTLTVTRYYADLEIGLAKLKESPTKKAVTDYYRFKLTFLDHINFTKYSGILSIEFKHSIIDRYLSLIKVLINLLAVSNFFESGSKNNKLKDYLKNRLDYLIRKVKDPVIFKLKLLSGDSLFPAFDKDESELQIRIHNNYTLGDYSKVEIDSLKLLKDNPTQFDLYILYAKSLIQQKKDFIPIGNKGSIQNEILESIYKITLVNTNPKQLGLNLLRIANSLSSSSLSYGITDFVFYQTRGKEERRLLSMISYNLANPSVQDVFTEEKEKAKFLEFLESHFPTSIAIKFYLSRLGGIEEIKSFRDKIPLDRYKTELALLLQKENKFLSAIEYWKYLIKNYSDKSFVLETAITNLFQCYLKLEEIDECIDLYVDSYFENNFIIEKIETKELLKIISSNRFRNVKRTINLPLFYTIVDADEVESHIAYELFNLANSVEKPSDLISISDNFENHKFRYFIEFTCTSQILRHSTYIINSRERLEERLTLVRYLKSLDQNNKIIDAEIKNIENILVIQKGLIDLDESKIYVNEQGIIEGELQDYEAIFERFKIISSVSNRGKLLYIKGGQLTLYSTNLQNDEIEYSNDPGFEIYLELFEAVKDKFLNSQFGIVAYLSTRIRHGVLVGELRPIFEKHKLITLKEGSTSNYRNNYHWEMLYSNHSSEIQTQIQIHLADFSGRVDGLIFDLIKRYLQVYQVDINEEGWFNYEFESEELTLEYITATHIEEFNEIVESIFKVLWKRTDKNLEKIREKIESEILVKFNDHFNQLERNLINDIGEVNSQLIIKSIKDCSTEIQTVIKKISRWFKRSEIKAGDFSLEEVVTIISEYVNNSSPNKRLLLEKNIDQDIVIKGIYKTHFGDLIRIFLENVIKHSSGEARDLRCRISTEKLNDEKFSIKIENELSDDRSIELLKNLWSGNKLDLTKLHDEGKSGYHKAYKILTSDLKCSKKECLSTSISEEKESFIVTLVLDSKDILK